MHISKLIYGLLILLFGVVLIAGEPSEDSDSDQQATTMAETITVTAELTPVRIKEATAKVSVINAKQIEAGLVNDYRDLVRYEPGVYIANDGSRLGLNGFNIRGIGGNRVLTRIDGVAAAEQFSFGPLAIHQQAIDVDLLKSVEILRSASSSLYGSDALGGVVSLATKDPVDFLRLWGRESGFGVKTGFDSENNSSDIGLIGAMNLGDFAFMVNATHRNYEARDNMGDNNALDASRTAPNDLDGASTQLLAKLVRQFNDGNSLRLTVEHYDNQVETQMYSARGVSQRFGVVTDVSDYLADDRQERLRLSLDQQIFTEAAWLDDWRWQVHYQTGETDQTTREERATTTPGGVQNILRTGAMDFEQTTFGGEMVFGKSFVINQNQWRLTYGLALEQSEFGQLRDRRDLDLDTGNPDAYTGSLIFPTRYFPTSTVDESGGFVQLSAGFFGERLKITPGLRYDRFELKPDESDAIYLESTGTTELPAGLVDDATSAKLGILVKLSENLTWTGHFAEGFRAVNRLAP